MPAYLYHRAPEIEHLVRESARWGFDQRVAPLIELLDDIYQVPGITRCLGDDLHEILRATLNGELP